MSHDDEGASSDCIVQTVLVPKSANGGRLGRLAVSDADVNIKLLSRLAETAVTSGDIKTALEAVRACTAEAGNLYQIAIAERSAAAAANRAAAEACARAEAMREAAADARAQAELAQQAAADQHTRAMAAQEAATALRAQAAIMRDEAVAQQARAVQMREEAAQVMADLEAQRKADQRKRAIPRRLRVSDINGLDLRPDPSTAQAPAEYIEALRQFRLWAGNPSFRDLAKRCGQRPVASTICKILQGGELPSRFEVIDSIIIACGGTDEDRQRFATAWRQLVLPERQARTTLHAVPKLTTSA